MNPQQLEEDFRKRIDDGLVKSLFEEFRQAKTAYGLSDTIETLNRGGQFCEVCIACIVNIADPNEGKHPNGVKFDAVVTKLSKLPRATAEDELLYAVIPTVLKSVWTVRSKKKVVHFKSNIPEETDALYVITSCNWVMAQLITVFHTNNQQEVEQILISLMERKIPTIQEFEDNKIMILKDLGFGEQLLLLLYKWTRRMTIDELDALLKPKQRSYVNTYLTRLYAQKLIHYDSSGAIITRLGIAEIENHISKYFNVDK